MTGLLRSHQQRFPCSSGLSPFLNALCTHSVGHSGSLLSCVQGHLELPSSSHPRHRRSSPHTPLTPPSPFQAQREPRGLPASPWVSCHTHTVWVTVLNAFFMFLKCTHRALKGRRTKLLSQGGLFPPICLHNVPQSLCNAASSTQPCLSLCLLEWRTVPVLQSVPSDVVSHPRCFATATESLN